jgi:hypothetical protein
MTNNTSAINCNPFISFSIRFLPARMKRLMYLASLTAIAKGTKIPEEQMMSKLNTLLNLSTTGDAALKLPIYISQLIWSNKEVFKNDIEVLTKAPGQTESAKESASRIIDATPTWFKYGDKQTVMHDILEIFTGNKGMFPVQTA